MTEISWATAQRVANTVWDKHIDTNKLVGGAGYLVIRGLLVQFSCTNRPVKVSLSKILDLNEAPNGCDICVTLCDWVSVSALDRERCISPDAWQFLPSVCGMYV